MLLSSLNAPLPPARPGWRDVSAGLCVAGLLLPEAVAYAGLAHLPVSHALTAMLVGLALYALLGGSRFAIVAPTSSSAALAGAAVLSLTGGSTVGAYLPLLMGLVLLAGLVLMLLGLAHQGQLSAFISRPVLQGFAFALAVTIVIRQLPDALGLVPQSAPDPLRLLVQLLARWREWQGPSVLVALCAAAGLVLLRRRPRWPASMLVILLAVAASRGLDLPAHGVAQVGALAAPDWRLAVPDLSWDRWLQLGELAAGLVVLLFAESWGSIRGLALRRGERVQADRELWVLGLCNVASALLQGMPVGAGFSASSANAGAGARSRWAGVCALAVLAAALAWALPLLQWLPRPVLAVAVVAALWHVLDLQPLLRLWRIDRDRVPALGAVAAVLAFGVLHGLLVAVALSLLAALRRFSQPVVHELGEMGHSGHFVVLEAHADAAAVPGLLILRPEEPLFFASAERVVGEVLARLPARGGPVALVLSLEESSDLDSTALDALLELDQRLAQRGVHLVLSRVKDRVRELLTRCDPQGLGAPQRLFHSVRDAVQACRPAAD